MAAKKATANIWAGIYEGDLDLGFDCAGIELCKYALCHVMPPDGSEDCTYHKHGSCHCPQAKQEAVDSLRKKLNSELKKIEEELEG